MIPSPTSPLGRFFLLKSTFPILPNRLSASNFVALFSDDNKEGYLWQKPMRSNAGLR